MSIERLSPVAPQSPESGPQNPATRTMTTRESITAYIVPVTIGMVVLGSVVRQSSPDISFSRRGGKVPDEEKQPSASNIAAQESMARISPDTYQYDPLANWTKVHRTKKLNMDGSHILLKGPRETPKESLERIGETSGAPNIVQKNAIMRANLRADAVLKRRAEIEKIEALYGPSIGDEDAVKKLIKSGGRTFSEKRRMRLASKQHRSLKASIERIENRLEKQAGPLVDKED